MFQTFKLQGYADHQSAHPAGPENRRGQGQGSGAQVQSTEARLAGGMPSTTDS
jgi:hypothetical protein